MSDYPITGTLLGELRYWEKNNGAPYHGAALKELGRLTAEWCREAEDCEQQRARADSLAADKIVFADKLIEAGTKLFTLRAALEKIRSVVGTSTEAWHFADDALSGNL